MQFWITEYMIITQIFILIVVIFLARSRSKYKYSYEVVSDLNIKNWKAIKKYKEDTKKKGDKFEREKRQAENDLEHLKEKKAICDQTNQARAQKILSWKRTAKELLNKPNQKKQKNLINTITNTNTEVARKIKKTWNNQKNN